MIRHVVHGGGRMVHRLLRVTLAVVLAAAVASGALAWRLAQGPLEIGWLTRRLEAAVNTDGMPPVLVIGSTALAWEGFTRGVDHPLDIRLTGVALSLGLLALCYWLLSLADGERSYAAAAKLFASPVGILGLIGCTFAFLYHLLNGIRHLFWDAGFGFERPQRHVSGWFVLAGAAFLTACVWVLIWRAGP